MVEASSGAEAIQALGIDIDLVVTDTRIIASTFPNLPILYITGYNDIAAMQLNDAIIVQKTFSENDLQAKIGEAYRGRS